MNNGSNNFSTPPLPAADLLAMSAALQQSCSDGLHSMGGRSSSVIVQLDAGANGGGSRRLLEAEEREPPIAAIGAPAGGGGKRTREPEEIDREAAGREQKQPKLEEKSLSPEVCGVNRFISPFCPEAKIPLPHELNELSAHGTTVWRRNERERNRVRQVNDGYVQLRNQLPLTKHDRRLSKVDTLRLAIAYIRHLELLLVQGRGHQNDCHCFSEQYGDGEASSAENSPAPN